MMMKQRKQQKRQSE
jgi:hypothetical protein